MKSVTMALLVAICLGGCATLQMDNYEDSTLSAADMQIIANDGSDVLAIQYPPGQTTFSLKPVGAFGQLLVDALRQKGFGVEEQSATPLYYLLDQIDGQQQYRLGLITNDWRSDITYRRDGNNQLSRDGQTQRVKQ